MKTFKAISAATVLALFLSIPAFAEDPKPGEVHDPGKASCVCEMPGDPADATSSTTTVDSDFSLSAVVDLLWTVASVF
jgi:hypothetical protein